MAISLGKGGQVALPSGYLLHKQYTIENMIGNGGFGITYKAYDNKFKRPVAIKELFPNTAAIRDGKTFQLKVLPDKLSYFSHVKMRFLEEAKILYGFQNSTEIVDVYHLFEENQTAYFVMEYLTGMDLKHHLLQYGKQNWNQFAPLLKQILQGLSVLHSKNLIHRDISPDNIFITKDGRAKLIDFGSVRCYSNAGGFTTFLKEAFAPYEQYRENGKQGPWTDIYSLSVTIYYALTGIIPPKAPERIMNDTTVPLQNLCPELPVHVVQGITKGMSVAQEQRFQNVHDFIHQLFPTENIVITGQIRQTAVPVMRDVVQKQRVVPKQTPQMMRRVVCKSGYHKGRYWDIQPGMTLTLGRDTRCQISYAPNSTGISRVHCSLTMDGQGKVFVRDEKSTNGTYVNQKRVVPLKWYLLNPGMYFSFAQEIYQLL